MERHSALRPSTTRSRWRDRLGKRTLEVPCSTQTLSGCRLPPSLSITGKRQGRHRAARCRSMPQQSPRPSRPGPPFPPPPPPPPPRRGGPENARSVGILCGLCSSGTAIRKDRQLDFVHSLGVGGEEGASSMKTGSVRSHAVEDHFGQFCFLPGARKAAAPQSRRRAEELADVLASPPFAVHDVPRRGRTSSCNGIANRTRSSRTALKR